MSLERDLERALRHRSPDPGFAERVMARIDNGEGATELRPPRWRAAAASLTLVVLLGSYATHRVVENRRGERAKEQVLLAMGSARPHGYVARPAVRALGHPPQPSRHRIPSLTEKKESHHA
jgi:hypothetical protein